jgi:hypothetical protein
VNKNTSVFATWSDREKKPRAAGDDGRGSFRNSNNVSDTPLRTRNVSLPQTG